MSINTKADDDLMKKRQSFSVYVGELDNTNEMDAKPTHGNDKELKEDSLIPVQNEESCWSKLTRLNKVIYVMTSISCTFLILLLVYSFFVKG